MLIILTVICIEFERPASEKQSACIKMYNLHNSTNPWRRLNIESNSIPAQSFADRASTNSTDFPEPYRKYCAEFLSSHWSKSDMITLTYIEEKFNISVNSMMFSKLERTSALRGKKYTGTHIGTCYDKNFLKQPEIIADFLLSNQIIRTYLHIESRFCLIRTKQKGNIHLFEYTGEHIYYTNTENREALHFSIHINTDSGEIVLYIL